MRSTMRRWCRRRASRRSCPDHKPEEPRLPCDRGQHGQRGPLKKTDPYPADPLGGPLKKNPKPLPGPLGGPLKPNPTPTPQTRWANHPPGAVGRTIEKKIRNPSRARWADQYHLTRQPTEPPHSPGSLLCALCTIWVLHAKPLNSNTFRAPCYMCYMCYMGLTRQAAQPPLSPSSLLYVLYYSVRALKCTICAIQCIFGTC